MSSRLSQLLLLIGACAASSELGAEAAFVDARPRGYSTLGEYKANIDRLIDEQTRTMELLEKAKKVFSQFAAEHARFENAYSANAAKASRSSANHSVLNAPGTAKPPLPAGGREPTPLAGSMEVRVSESAGPREGSTLKASGPGAKLNSASDITGAEAPGLESQATAGIGPSSATAAIDPGSKGNVPASNPGEYRSGAAGDVVEAARGFRERFQPLVPLTSTQELVENALQGSQSRENTAQEEPSLPVNAGPIAHSASATDGDLLGATLEAGNLPADRPSPSRRPASLPSAESLGAPLESDGGNLFAQVRGAHRRWQQRALR